MQQYAHSSQKYVTLQNMQLFKIVTLRNKMVIAKLKESILQSFKPAKFNESPDWIITQAIQDNFNFKNYTQKIDMLSKFTTHKNINYFLLYAAGYFAYGAHFSGLGPFIPYLAAESGIIQTEYAYLFSCRSFAMCLGAIAIKLLQAKKVQNHTIIIIGAVVMSIFAILFSLADTTFWLGVWMFLSSFGYTVLQVIINVCILMVNPPEQIQFWMLVTHAVFGLGALFGPIFVYLFEQNSFICFGLLSGVVIPFYFKIKSPQLNGFSQQTRNTIANQKKVSFTIQLMLGFLLFLYIGSECTYGGWISSFVVLIGITDNQGATQFPSIFWIFMTIFRFALAFAPGTSSIKLKYLIQANIISGLVILGLIHLGHLQFSSYLSTLLFGFSMSVIYPLVFTYPIQSGLNIEEHQTTNIIVFAVLAEGILTMFAGKLMEWFGPNMLFWSIIGFSVMMWILRYTSLILIYKQVNGLSTPKQLQVQLLPVKTSSV